jgi:hypothetical protein
MRGGVQRRLRDQNDDAALDEIIPRCDWSPALQLPHRSRKLKIYDT